VCEFRLLLSFFFFVLFVGPKKSSAELNAIAIYRHEIAATKIFESRFMVHAAVVNQISIFWQLLRNFPNSIDACKFHGAPPAGFVFVIL